MRLNSRRFPGLSAQRAAPAVLLALALLAAGCDVFTTTTTTTPTSQASSAGPSATRTAAGQSSGAPSASSRTSPGGSATASAPATTAPPTPTPVPTPTPSPTPEPTPKACTSRAPSALSAEWQDLKSHDGDYTFKFPKDWEHLYGAFLFKTNTLLDPETLAETGLPADHTTKADLVRAPDDGIPNASVLIVPGVLAKAEDVYLRQELRFRQIPGAQILRTDIEMCLDGQTAYGVEFLFGEEETLQRSFYVVHNGRSYDFQWLATKEKPDLRLFDEMARTWKWTPDFPVATPLPPPSPTPAPSGASPAASPSAFVTAGMAPSIVPGAPEADTSTFTTTLSKDLRSIYAVFVLRDGLEGRVEGDLMKGDQVLATLALNYQGNHSWGDFRINSATGFAPGTDYEMRIRYMPTGEEIRLPFTVE